MTRNTGPPKDSVVRKKSAGSLPQSSSRRGSLLAYGGTIGIAAEATRLGGNAIVEELACPALVASSNYLSQCMGGACHGALGLFSCESFEVGGKDRILRGVRYVHALPGVGPIVVHAVDGLDRRIKLAIPLQSIQRPIRQDGNPEFVRSAAG